MHVSSHPRGMRIRPTRSTRRCSKLVLWIGGIPPTDEAGGSNNGVSARSQECSSRLASRYNPPHLVAQIVGKREVIIAARERDQGRIAFDFAVGFMRGLPETVQAQFTVRRSPQLEIGFDGDGGGHLIRVIAADGKSALGGAPTLILMDVRGHLQADQGDALEQALLSGMGIVSSMELLDSYQNVPLAGFLSIGDHFRSFVFVLPQSPTSLQTACTLAFETKKRLATTR